MQPIEELLALFYIITLDFIFALPSSHEEFDCLLLVTEKVNKKYCLILGKITWKAGDWAKVLIRKLLKLD